MEELSKPKPLSEFRQMGDIRRPVLNFRDAIYREVYKFICTNSERYSKERNQIIDGTERLVLILATAIATSLGISLAIVIGIIAAILLTVLKIGKNAWCEMYKDILN